MRFVFIAVLGGCFTACSLSSGGGSPPDAAMGGCAKASDCVVVPQSCCGQCGAATVGDAVAILRTRVSEHQQMACEGVNGCPACFGENDPNLTAACQAGQCQLVDIRQEPSITSCTSADECKVRLSGCCGCQEVDFERVIAIRNDAEGAYRNLTCDPGFGCPECDPSLAPALADCAANRCTVAILTDNLR